MARALLVAFALAGCSSPVADVNWQVNHNHPYQHYAKRDLRELRPGEGGNCAAIAYTKQAELARRGIKSKMMMCRLASGEGHAFLLTDEGVLDNRYDRVIGFGEVGCVW